MAPCGICRSGLHALGIATLAVAIASGGPRATAGAQSGPTRTWTADTPIGAEFITPRPGDCYACSTFDPAPIAITVRFWDYDGVTYTSADGTTSFPNRERGTDRNPDDTARYTVRLEKVLPDGTKVLLAPVGAQPSRSAVYSPALADGLQSETVTVRCTITDNDQEQSRRDPDTVISPDLTFTVIRFPTIDIGATSVKENAQSNGVPDTPITSGFAANDGVKLQFSVGQRAGGWILTGTNVQWSTPFVDGTGLTITTVNRIPKDSDHRRFDFSAAALFYFPMPPPFPPLFFADTKTRSRVLAFDPAHHDELDDTSRGHSAAPGSPNQPPNWFDTGPDATHRHWGDFIADLNALASYLQPTTHIVYYAPHFLNIDDLYGYADYLADHAPSGTPDHRGDPAYRGRIYLLRDVVDHTDANPVELEHSPKAGGVDLVAQVLAHEYSHRDMFLAAWGGFDVDHIGGPAEWGGPGWFYPGSGYPGLDTDSDRIRDDFEHAHRDDFHLHEGNAFSLFQWWTGGAQGGYMDDEMHARLWGSWSYQCGTHDANDWSVAGRKDY